MADKKATQRVEFTHDTRAVVARKAMYVCSNPECLRLTGFVTEKGKPRAIAQAAHILAAGDKGPRREDEVILPDGTRLERGSEGNAVWLCVPCHIRVDADSDAYASSLLLEWKRAHETLVSSLVGLDLEQSLLKLGGIRRSHDTAREFLMWLDSHRVMYVDIMYESPREARLALDALRHKLTQMRATIHGTSSLLGTAISATEDAVLAFFHKLRDIQIDDIAVTSGIPEFERFRDALREVRAEILEAVTPLAEAEGFAFERIGR
ncbi:hypothetical protein F6W70_09670 [Microbacterium maritypicum]|uniref:HNH endonuclease n=1 Tax=Microbacterium maritypicum TaxID=33918 RepID=A0AAD3X5H6_MICMQ|nr:hypothetical protein [Microbacterium liquefaciens]KAB1887624.1 hypothetical protein F6W70_09670 [Microbacterium liquefaciens]